MENLDHQVLDYAVAGRPLLGESDSGDLHLIHPFHKGMLVAVVDGLGHGAEAAKAAQRAVSVLRDHAGEAVPTLFELCHQDLLHGRGVVMSLASFNTEDSSMTWIGVGNVCGVFVRAGTSLLAERETLLLRSGVVGVSLPALGPAVLPVSRGDILILASDGVADGFQDEAVSTSDSPQAIADRLLAAHIKGVDDALVVVARFQGDVI